MSSASPEVMKWFTRARRFPQLIGRTPDGARIPGGPYTVTQVIGAGAVLFIGTRTMGLWAHYGLLSNAMVLAAVTFAVVFGLGKIPVGSRNPVSVSSGALRALSAPPSGRVAGRPVRIRRPHQVRHQLVTLQPAPPAALPTAAQPTPASSAPALSAPALTVGAAAMTAVTDPTVETAGSLPWLVAAVRRRLAPLAASAAAAARAARTARPRPAAPRPVASHAAPPATQPARPDAQPPVPPQRATPALTGVQALLARTPTAPPAPAAAPFRPAASSCHKDR